MVFLFCESLTSMCSQTSPFKLMLLDVEHVGDYVGFSGNGYGSGSSWE